MTAVMELDDFLAHHGVKGMKWGVRKNYRELKNAPRERVTLKTQKGKSVTLQETGNGRLAAAIGAVIPKWGDAMRRSRGFDIEVDGKRVGNTHFRERGNGELNLMWVGIDRKQRGQGYASTVFDAGVEYAKSKGYKQLTLEVPGNAPDAKHIYEKRGFKQTGPVQGSPNDIWGGLTPMALDISGSEIRHASTDPVTPAEMELAFIQHMKVLQIDNIVFPEEEGSGMTHAMNPDDFLAHFGVKGMKWGVRKDDIPGVSTRVKKDAKKDAEELTRAKMFYGKGAGTRRKLIKATVEAKSAKDPNYKKALDHYVGNTDMDKRASQAKKERRRKNVAGSTAKTARGVGHILNGNNQYANVAAVAAVAGATYAHQTGADKIIYDAAKTKVSDIKKARS